MTNTGANTELGLRQNWRSFALLLIINAFVGGMVGLERTIIPEYAEYGFGLSSKSALLSFIVAFGLTKALANYYAGRWANQVGRKKLLWYGWWLAIPVPWILIYAPHWNWVVLANVLLGASQGLTWSSTVVMKIDLVGDKHRGLAMGLNEFSGYVAVGVVAFLTGWVASHYGVTPYPFYIGVVISVLGLLLTGIWVRDTRAHVALESKDNNALELSHIFKETTLTHPALSSVTQAGLINNLNDGMVWGLLPILLMNLHFDVERVGWVTAAYPMVWGLGQLFTGRMSDLYSKKAMLFWGMLLQGMALLGYAWTTSFWGLLFLSVVLGLGTALVYPTFLSSIAQVAHPQQRAETIGVFRLWRDAGYAVGAILSGIIADAFGVITAIMTIAGLTILSALIIQWRMPRM